MKPYYEIPEGQIYHGHALDVLRSMDSETMGMCVTSPPYWGLRDYGVPGQIGLEKTPEEYIEKMVEIFRELRRVLRNDGTLWLNMGDSYTSGNRKERDPGQSKIHPAFEGENFKDGLRPETPAGMKTKDLCGIPWMLAFALRADGWYLRSAMPWVKRSAMPESVTDRPASALEYMFLLTKSSKYYFDMDAIRVPHKTNGEFLEIKAKGMSEETKEKISSFAKDRPRDEKGVFLDMGKDALNPGDGWQGEQRKSRMPRKLHPSGRNFRNTDLFFESLREPYGMIFCGDEMVGIDCNPQAMKEAHFATFPEKLIEPCILAGTSEKGCCVECGAPWSRVVEKRVPELRNVESDYPGEHSLGTRKYKHGDPGPESKTMGWKPSCECGELKQDQYTDGSYARSETFTPVETTPCTVLDPFGGAMTTAIVAHKHGRKFVMIELSKAYIDEIGVPRIEKATKQRKLW